MKTWKLRAMVAVAALGPLVLLTVGTVSRSSSSVSTLEAQERLEYGRYLVNIMACHDCHTPKRMTVDGPVRDTARLLSGHPEEQEILTQPASSEVWPVSSNEHHTAWSGPWGISFAINLTPDLETGLGGWSEDMFLRALRTGKHMGEGRPILPPMPWQSYGELTDDDLRAVFAYLQTIPPVANVVPDPIPPGGRKSSRS